MTKIGQPYRCDGPSCGKLRDTDANHWWLIEIVERPLTKTPDIIVSPWNAEDAEREGTKHSCGIDCSLKITGVLMAAIVDTNRNSSPAAARSVTASAGKEVSDAKS